MDPKCDNKKKRNRSRKKKSANVQAPSSSSAPETSKSFSGQPVVMSSTIQQKLSEDEFCQLCFDAIAAIHDKSASLQSNPPTRLPVAKGFINSGNTCFLNCVVQSLFSTPLFLRYVWTLLSYLYPSPILDPATSLPLHTVIKTPPSSWVNWSSLLALAKDCLVADPALAISPSGYSSPSSTPAAFMGQIEWDFRSSHQTPDRYSASHTAQADAMEFFTFLLDRLHEEMRSCNGKNEVSGTGVALQGAGDDEDDGGGWNEVCRGGLKSKLDDKSRKDAVEVNSSSVISQIFHGTMRSEIKFKRKKANSITFQRFHCITLDINHQHQQDNSHISKANDQDDDEWSQATSKKKSKNIRKFGQPFQLSASSSRSGSSRNTEVDLSTVFEEYFQAESISDGNMHKTVTMESPPAVLILNLKRFAYDPYKGDVVKIQRAVSYPSILHVPSTCMSADLLTSLQLRAAESATRGLGSGVCVNGLSDPSTSTVSKGYTVESAMGSESESSHSDDDDGDFELASTFSHLATANTSRRLKEASPVRNSGNSDTDGKSDKKKSNKHHLLSYKLQGIILHHGQSAESGHYSCFCLDSSGDTSKGQDNVWRHVDDTNITKATAAQVLAAKQQAYVLIYARQQSTY